MRARRTVPTLVATTLLTLGATACGGDSADPSGDAAPAPSPTETSASSPPTPAEEPSSEGDEAAATPDAEVAAFLSRLRSGFGDEGSVHVRMTMRGPTTMTAQGATTYGPDGSDLRMSMAAPGMDGGEKITVLVVDQAVYLSMPGVTPQGKFFQVPEDSPLLADLRSTGMSPAESLAGFEAGLEEVEAVGSEPIAGEPTEHYRLHVDAARATEAMGTRPGAGALPETLVYDVWLDSRDRMRRLRYSVGGSSVTMDMTRWGEDADISAPAPDELVKAPDLGSRPG